MVKANVKLKVSIFIIVALLMQLVSSSFISAASTDPVPIVIEDNNALLNYSGVWSFVESDGYSGGQASFSKDRSASVSFSFLGTGFSYIGSKEKSSLPFVVIIDGVTSNSMNPSSSKVKNQQVLFETKTLSYTTHNVTIRLATTTPANLAVSNIINVDAIKLFTAALVSPGQPTSTYTNSNVKIQWPSVQGATGYKVYRSTRSNDDFSLIADSSSMEFDTNFNDPFNTSTIPADIRYFYAVTSIGNGGLESSLSKVTSVVIPKNTASIPNGLKAVNVGNVVTITWSSSANASSYKVYRRSSTSDSFDLIAENLVDASYIDNSFASNIFKATTNYYYYVSAVNGFETESAKSSAVTASLKTPLSMTDFSGLFENGAVQLQWSTVEHAELYKIYRSNDGKAYNLISDSSVTGLTYADVITPVNLNANLKFYYAVSAVDSMGNESAYLKKTTIVIPKNSAAVPYGTKAFNDKNSIKLTWLPSSNAISYNIYRSSAKDGTYDLIGESNSASTTTFTDESFQQLNVAAKTKYYYRISAVNLFDAETSKSNAIGVTIYPLAGPGQVTAQLQNEGQVAIQWTAVTGAVSYKIYRSNNSKTGFEAINSIPINVTNYMDQIIIQTLPVDTTYYYGLVWVDREGNESLLSSKVSIVMKKNAATVPTSVKAVKGSNDVVNLSWNITANAISYKVYRSTAITGPFELISEGVTISAGTHSFTDSFKQYAQISETSNVYYSITATNILNTESVKSTPIKVTFTPTLYPKSVTGIMDNTNNVRLNWSSVSNAIGYKVYRSTQADTGYQLINTTIVTNPAFSDNLLNVPVVTGQIIFYKIAAINSSNQQILTPAIAVAVVKTILAPASVQAIATPNGATLSWTEVIGASGYSVYRVSAEDGEYKLLDANVTGLTYVDESLTQDKLTDNPNYTYSIKAFEPTIGLSNETLSNSIAVFKNYNLLVSSMCYDIQATDNTWVMHNNSEFSVTFTVYEDVTGQSVSYSVQAKKDITFTTDKSSDSDEIIVSVNGLQELMHVVSSNIACTAEVPTEFSLALLNKNVNLKWLPAKNAQNYNLYRAYSTEGPYLLVQSGLTVTEITDSFMEGNEVDVNTDYYYAVSSVNSQNVESAMSESIKVTFVPLSYPKIFTATANEDNMVTLNWNNVAYASGYQIYRSTEPDTGYTLINESILTDTTFTDDLNMLPVHDGQLIYYKVGAINISNIESLIPSYAFVHVIQKPILAPSIVDAIATANGANLTWTSIPDAVGYKVYRSSGESAEFNLVSGSHLVVGEIFEDSSLTPDVLKNNPNYIYAVSSVGNFGKESSSTLSNTVSALNQNQLMISSMCYEYPIKKRAWKVQNTSNFSITFTVFVEGSNEVINLIIQANSELTFETIGAFDRLTTFASGLQNAIHVTSSAQACVAEIPASLTGSVTGKTVILNWNSSKNAAGYKVYRTSVSNEVYGVSVTSLVYEFVSESVPGSLITYIDHSLEGLASNTVTQFNYSVSAINDNNIETDKSLAALVSIPSSISPAIEYDNSFNVMVNSDFEEGNGNIANFWHHSISSGVVESLQMVSSPVFTGEKAQRITTSNMKLGDFDILYQNVPVPLGGVYTLSGRFNIINLNNAKIQLYVNYYDAQDKWLGKKSVDQNSITDGYVELKLEGVVPDTTKYIIVYARLEATGAQASASFLIDSFKFVAGGNSMINNDFEEGVGNIANFWRHSASTGIVEDLQMVASPTYSGSKAQKVSVSNMKTGDFDILYQNIAAPVSGVYTITGKYNVISLSNAKVQLYVNYYDAQDKWLGKKTTELFNTTNGYIELKQEGIVPDNTKYLSVYVRLEAIGAQASAIFYVDAFRFVEGGNMLLNNDFEEGNANLATSWRHSISAGVTQDLQLVSSPASSGGKAQKIAVSNMKIGDYDIIYQNVVAPKSGVYTLTGNFNVETLNNAKLQLYVNYYDALDKWLGKKSVDQLTTTNGYVQLKQEGIVPATTKYLTVYARLEATGAQASATYYLDEFKFVAGGNTLVNGDFEDSVGNVANFWRHSASSGITADLQMASTPVFSGSKAQKISVTNMKLGDFDILYQNAPVPVGGVYSFSGKFNVVSLNNAKVQLFVNYYDAQDKWLGKKSIDLLTTTNGYVELKQEGIVPDTTKYITVYVRTEAIGAQASAILYVDLLKFNNPQ